MSTILGIQWKETAKENPPHNVEVLGWHKEWIDEDYNPKGVRVGFSQEGDEFISFDWNNCQDVYYTDTKLVPTHWMPLPEPPE